MKLPTPKTALTALLLVFSVPQTFALTPAKEAEKAGPRPAVAVLDFKASGGAAELGKSAAELLRTRLAEGGCQVTDRAALERALETRRLGMSGPLDRADAAALGRQLGVKNIVVGSVERSGGAYTLDVRFLDAATGETVSGNIITAKDPALCTEIAGNFTKKGFFTRPAAVKADPPARPEPPAPAPAPVKVSTAAPSEDVTYAQVLENPDDQALNYAYVRTQVRKGDLKGASSTLERMLLVDPSRSDIRLFYAVVLFRLDNLAEARREFETVGKAQVPEKARAEAAAYLKEISRRESPTAISGSLSAGAEYDSNRNASPAAQKLLFLDTPLQITGSSRKRDDTAFVAMGNAELKHTMNSPARHELSASAAYYLADQRRVDNLDLRALSFKAGGAYKAGRAEFRPALVYDRVTLGGDKFLVNSGGLLRFEDRLNKLTDYWAEAKYVHQNYVAVPDIASNPERRGGLWSLSAGGGRVLGPVTKLSADLAFTVKRAAKAYDAYDGAALSLRHSWLLGKGMFLLSSAAVGSDVYREADAMVSRKVRKDTTLRAGAVFGLPVGLLHRKLAGLKDLSLSLNLEHFRSNSTVMNYTYKNNKAALLLNYRWEAAL